MQRPQTVADRIRACRQLRKLTQGDLAKLCGWKTGQTRIANYERGDRAPSADVIRRIANATGCRAEWIQFGTGAREDTPHLAEDAGEYRPTEIAAGPDIALTQVPIVGTTDTGPDREWFALGCPAGYGEGYLDAPTKDHKAYALRVTGGSMAPRMRAGEVILVQPGTEPVPGDEIVVKMIDGQFLVRELVYWREGELALDGIAGTEPRIVIDERAAEYVHVIAGIFRASAVRKRRTP